MATISNKIAQTPNSRSQNTIQNAENVGRTLQNIYMYGILGKQNDHASRIDGVRQPTNRESAFNPHQLSMAQY